MLYFLDFCQWYFVEKFTFKNSVNLFLICVITLGISYVRTIMRNGDGHVASHLRH